jgi:hypothetical protein
VARRPAEALAPGALLLPETVGAHGRVRRARSGQQNDVIEITEAEANQIVERIRTKVTGPSNG